MNAQVRPATNPTTGTILVSREPFVRSASQTILVVEDDAMVRSFILKVLTRAGYRVVCATNGHEAIRCIDQDNVDLIITDLFMPQMDGMELVMHLRKQTLTIPIIAISGAISGAPSGQNDDILRTARLLGVKLTLAKPFLMQELIAAVRQLVGDPTTSVAH